MAENPSRPVEPLHFIAQTRHKNKLDTYATRICREPFHIEQPIKALRAPGRMRTRPRACERQAPEAQAREAREARLGRHLSCAEESRTPPFRSPKRDFILFSAELFPCKQISKTCSFFLSAELFPCKHSVEFGPQKDA